MSDFTKEELETISSWGNVYTEFGEHFTFKLHKPLIDKITSMIDNFGKSNRSCLCTLRESCPNCAEGF